MVARHPQTVCERPRRAPTIKVLSQPFSLSCSPPRDVVAVLPGQRAGRSCRCSGAALVRLCRLAVRRSAMADRSDSPDKRGPGYDEATPEIVSMGSALGKDACCAGVSLR